MAKLWDKGSKTDKLIERFTVGEDYVYDMNLVRADIYGNIAHARTLRRAGVLSDAELKRLEGALRKLLKLHEKGEFVISPELEDVHTTTENYLTEMLGPLGKKIHTGRSRNDQVITDMRLYMREIANDIAGAALDAAEKIADFAGKYAHVPMPGFTHTRAAMPGSVGLWAASIGEALLDDLIMLEAAYTLIDQCPLGSAAGYGVPIKLDREFTAKQLGFAKAQKNVMAVQNGRGKFELALASACQQIMTGLSRAATDIIFFSLPEFGFVSLPDRLTTGSSIMPQKRNPDAMELTRATAHAVNAGVAGLASTVTGLLSGYNRDLQLTKGPAMKVFQSTLDSLEIMKCTFEGLRVDEKRCADAFTPEIFAADAALEMVVKENIPFRDAYKIVGGKLGELKNADPVKILKSRTHLGAAGNLGLDVDRKRIQKGREKLGAQRDVIDKAMKNLLTDSTAKK